MMCLLQPHTIMKERDDRGQYAKVSANCIIYGKCTFRLLHWTYGISAP